MKGDQRSLHFYCILLINNNNYENFILYLDVGVLKHKILGAKIKKNKKLTIRKIAKRKRDRLARVKNTNRNVVSRQNTNLRDDIL